VLSQQCSHHHQPREKESGHREKIDEEASRRVPATSVRQHASPAPPAFRLSAIGYRLRNEKDRRANADLSPTSSVVLI
jgi:hypothetical protein